MNPIEIDARLQVMAGASLLENSSLVKWVPASSRFVPVEHDTFELSQRSDVDPVFGRLICWILFSAGAEFLAKGVCLANKVDIRIEQVAPAYPGGDIHAWVRRYRKYWLSAGKVKATNFGTIGDLHHSRVAGVDPALTRLCSAVNATPDQKDFLLAAYGLLGTTIRNRDAHAYVPNVRDLHFVLVPQLFTPCFNILIGWLPDGGPTLDKWRADAPAFIQSL